MSGILILSTRFNFSKDRGRKAEREREIEEGRKRKKERKRLEGRMKGGRKEGEKFPD